MSLTILILIRSVISFITLLIFARILGKQQLGQLTFFEYITGITIGSIASELSVDLTVRAWYQWVALLSWAALTLVFQVLTIRHRKAAVYLSGHPVTVVHNGKILEENMRKNRYRFDELFMQLRQQGVFNVNEVALAILETNGQLSVMKKKQNPADPRSFFADTDPNMIVAQEGQLLLQHIAQLGLTPTWVMNEIRRQGAASILQVSVAYLTPTGELYVDKYQDQPR